MKEILKKKPDSYTITCKHCDCKFKYQLEDIEIDYYLQEVIVCPECSKVSKHSERDKHD